MSKHLVVSGAVQGVGYRYEMARQAERLNVTGWVRNRRDGTVEAILDGPPAAVDEMLAWAERGPPGARVTGLKIEESDATFGTFEIWPTQ